MKESWLTSFRSNRCNRFHGGGTFKKRGGEGEAPTGTGGSMKGYPTHRGGVIGHLDQNFPKGFNKRGGRKISR